MAGGMGGDGPDGMAMAMPPPPSSGMVPGGGGGGNMHPMHGGGMVMHMTFFWGKHVQVLFSGWPGDSGLAMYLLSLLLVLLTAALLECLSLAVRRIARPSAAARRVPTALLLTALHAAQIGIAYLVMLAVMSFNVGVLIAAVAGHALGFLFSGSGLFKWSRAEEAQPNGTSDNSIMGSAMKC